MPWTWLFFPGFLFQKEICLWFCASQRFDVAVSVCCWPESKADRGTLRLIYRLSAERRLLPKNQPHLELKDRRGHFVIACKWFLSVFTLASHGFLVKWNWLATFLVNQPSQWLCELADAECLRMPWHQVPLRPCKSNWVFIQMAVKLENCKAKSCYSALFFDGFIKASPANSDCVATLMGFSKLCGSVCDTIARAQMKSEYF